MKVYEIFEAIEITPSATLGSDGKPAGFNVIDTDGNRTLKTFPDAGSAEEFRDQERARRTPAQTPDDSNNRNNRNTPAQNKPNEDEIKKKNLKMLKRAGKANLWLYGLFQLGFGAITTHNRIDTYRTALTDNNCDRTVLIVAQARRNLGKDIGLTVGNFLGTMLGGRLALPIIRLLATPFMALPGAGWFLAAVAAGSTYLISWGMDYLLKRDSVKQFLQTFIANAIATLIEKDCGVEESIDEESDALLESLKSNASADMKKAFADLVKDPRGKQELIKVKKAIKSKAS
jgi:hypothetical protein